MAMNRETKRLLQRQGALGEDGAPKATRRAGTVAHRAQGEAHPAEAVRLRDPRRDAQGRLADPARRPSTTRSSCSSR